MARLIGLLLLIGLFVVAVKVAIALLFLAGLIFRTKETIGLIAILAAFAGFNAHPAIGIGILVLIGIVALYRNGKQSSVEPEQLSKRDD